MSTGASDPVETDLRRTVEDAARALLAFGDAKASQKPAPGKWSPKEILGHLVDSASHNHQRFVRAQFTEDLVFPGYEQERWVSAQNYQGAPWTELVALWRSYNLHLSRVIAGIPAPARGALRHRHNLDEIAWKTIPAGQPATLEYFLRDYVEHLKHHVAQAFRALESR